MLAAQYGTISDIEVVWVALAIAGAIYSIRNFFDSWKDIKALDARGISNGRRKVAVLSRYQDGVRAVIHAVFGSIGGLAMTIADAPATTSSIRYAAIQATIRWGLIGGSLMLVSQSYMASRFRNEVVREELRRLENQSSQELLQKLGDYADQAEARRLGGFSPESDVARDKE